MAASFGLRASGMTWAAGVCLAAATLAPVVSAGQAKPPAAGVYSEAQAKRGETLYAENCSPCHLTDLSGGELSPSLKGPAFSSKWNAKGVAALFDYMRSAMPLNSPGGLSAQQNADILAFLLRTDGLPAGKADLSPQPDALKSITLKP